MSNKLPEIQVRVIGFNGRARSGKDTACEIVASMLAEATRPVIVQPMAEPLRELALPFVNTLTGAQYTITALDAMKDEPIIPGLPEARDGFESCSTWRDVLVWYSETVMKPRYGDDIFARLWCQRVAQHIDYIDCDSRTSVIYVLIPDCGFGAEWDYVCALNHYIMHYSCQLVRVWSHYGKEDSRELLPNPQVILNNEYDRNEGGSRSAYQKYTKTIMHEAIVNQWGAL